MKEFAADRETAAAEARLEWLLLKLHAESLQRGSKLTMPVLIGGTALRRAYGLTRPSTDLDFAVENEGEMKRLLRAAKTIARRRWPQAQMELRTDGEEGWTITDGKGLTLMHIGGLEMSTESIGIADWRRETWTLPMSRLAAMKIHTGLKLRNKVRDLYDMGFIAEQYPGDITRNQAEQIASAGYEATRQTNRWTEDHAKDTILGGEELMSLGHQVVRAAGTALEHIDGAKNGAWMNQSQATADLRETAQREPNGKFEVKKLADQAVVTWRRLDGEPMWEAVVENEARAKRLPVQAEIGKDAIASAIEPRRVPQRPTTRKTRG